MDNKITTGLIHLAGSLPSLVYLDLTNNKIQSLSELKPLARLPKLTKLNLYLSSGEGDHTNGYRADVLRILTGLRVLDDRDMGGNVVESEEEDDEEDDDEEEEDEEENGEESEEQDVDEEVDEKESYNSEEDAILGRQKEVMVRVKGSGGGRGKGKGGVPGTKSTNSLAAAQWDGGEEILEDEEDEEDEDEEDDDEDEDADDHGKKEHWAKGSTPDVSIYIFI